MIYFLMACHLIIPVLLLIAAYEAILYIQKTNSLRQGISELYDKINSLSGCRMEVGMKLKSLYGNMGRRGLIAHITDNLEYSGVTTRFERLTPELYIVIMIALSTVAAVFVSIIFGKLYMGFLAFAVPWILFEIFFSWARNYRCKKEEEQLLALVNSVENVAAESDDIIYILEKSSRMIEGPLSEALIHTVATVKSGIQGAVALRQLESRIEHSFFKTFIRNLEISSRNNANYREITAQCRKLLAEQLENSKKLEQIYHQTRIRLLIILICAIICLEIMARTMLGMSLFNMFLMFSKSVIGCFLIAMIGGTLIFTAYFLLIKGRRRRG